MTLWTWVVLSAQVHLFHLAGLAIAATLYLAAEQSLTRHRTKRKEKNVTKIRTWACLTLAATLALLAGGRRLAEGIALDPDNRVTAR